MKKNVAFLKYSGKIVLIIGYATQRNKREYAGLIQYYILLNICVVTGRANITYYERSQSVIKLRAAYHRAIIGLIT